MHRKHRIPRLVFDRGIRRYKRNTNDTICNNTRSGIQSNIHHSNSIISSYSIPIGCSVALLLLGLVCVNPVVGLGGWLFSSSDSVYANENSGISLYDAGDPNITLTINGSTNLSTNVAAGETSSISKDFSISSSGLSDYNVSVQAISDTDNSLTGMTSQSKISSITTSKPYTSISDNEWGYAIASAEVDATTLTYKPVPMSSSVLTPDMSGTGNINGDYSINFAAKFGTDLPADHYKANVLLSVAAGAKEVVSIPTDFAGYTKFEEVTPTVCNTIASGTEGRLQDSRDGKWYWVGKLPDGNCWMTQNLAYVDYGTPSVVFNSGTSSKAQYYNQNKYAYAGLSNTLYCSNINTARGLENCLDKGWVDLDDMQIGWTATDDPNFINATSYPSTDGRVTCTKVAKSLVGNSNQDSYCNVYYYTYSAIAEHYSAGSYYNWLAATAGATVAANAETTSSICPTGWKLPIGGNDNSGNGSFVKLVNGQNYSTLASAPYYFTPTGYVGGDSALYSSMYSIGDRMYYLSGIMNTYSVGGWYLVVTTSSISHTGTTSPRSSYEGLTIRCVAR